MKKDLKYYRENAEEDYMTTPISVLRYIGEVERAVKLFKGISLVLLYFIVVSAILILNK